MRHIIVADISPHTLHLNEGATILLFLALSTHLFKLIGAFSDLLEASLS